MPRSACPFVVEHSYIMYERSRTTELTTGIDRVAILQCYIKCLDEHDIVNLISHNDDLKHLIWHTD